MAPGKDTLVYWGQGKTTLRQLAKKYGFSTCTIYQRWRRIGRPERVFSWLFLSSREWAEKKREIALEPADKKERSAPMPFSSEWGMLSATENTGAARHNIDDAPKSYRRNSMGTARAIGFNGNNNFRE